MWRETVSRGDSPNECRFLRCDSGECWISAGIMSLKKAANAPGPLMRVHINGNLNCCFRGATVVEMYGKKEDKIFS